MNKNTQLLATVAAFLSQTIFGFSFLFTKIALKSASPFVVLADRYLVAFLVMTLVVLLTKTKIRFSSRMWLLILMALFQPILYFLFETYGIRMTTSSFSSVMLAMIPVVSMLSIYCIVSAWCDIDVLTRHARRHCASAGNFAFIGGGFVFCCI